MQDNLEISSVLTRKDSEKLSHTINILMHLARLKSVLMQSGTDEILTELKNAI